MALGKLSFLVFLLFICYLTVVGRAQAQVDDTSLQLMTDGFEWPTTTTTTYPFEEEEEADGGGGGGLTSNSRRSLYWHRFHFYISYGALSANRVPCPPRSGRSYYTHNCYRARGPVHPYTRGCSAITLCRR